MEAAESPPPDKKPKQSIHIRWSIRRDMPELLQIEQASFEGPWNEEDFLRCMRQRNVIPMIAEVDEKVVGFMIYELHKKKIHLLNFAVHPDYRRRGVGEQLVDRLISKLSLHHRTSVTLELRESNRAAQEFFKKMGFKATGVQREFYEDTGEDAFSMCYTHPECAQTHELDTTNRLSEFFKEEADSEAAAGPEAPEYDHAKNIEGGGTGQLYPGEQETPPLPEYIPPSAPKKFSELARLVQSSWNHLQELTGREWRVMKADESGTLKQLNKIPHNLGLEDFNKLVLETGVSILNPEKAYDGLRTVFFNSSNRLPDDMQPRNKKAQRIRVPAKYLKEEYLSNGTAGILEESFSPLRLEDRSGDAPGMRP